VEEIRDRAFAEVKAGKGHDVFIFPWPPAEFHQNVIDHAAVYQMVAPKYGAVQQLAFRSTLNLATKKYFAFADFWMPSPLHFFQDYWAQVGMPLGPVHYGSLLSGGKMMREKLGIPCGLAFSPTLEGNVTLHTILYAHRAWIMDSRGNLLFNKNAFAATALNYIHALYHESGTPEQLTWGSGDNVRAMLGHKASSAINAISLLRAAEKQNPGVAKNLWIQPPLIGSSGMGVTALPHVTNCSVVWNFAQNQAGAGKFLADMVDSSRTGYEKSLGCNFPIYPKTVPDIVVRLHKDPQAGPSDKYMALKDALHWTPNLGVPGFATPAYMEIFTSSLVPKMVARIINGEQTPPLLAPWKCNGSPTSGNRSDQIDVDESKRKQPAKELRALGGTSMSRQKITSIFLVMALVTSGFALPTVTVLRKSPEFAIADSSGKTTQLSSFKGKVVVMEFLFVKSQHCMHVAAILNKLNNELGPSGFQAVGIVFDPPNTAQTGEQLLPVVVDSLKLTYPLGYASKDDVDNYLGRSGNEILNIPQLVVIDRAGMIRATSGGRGGDPTLEDENSLRTLINGLLK
jgi:multiple sugar transport system substrate-binding protein